MRSAAVQVKKKSRKCPNSDRLCNSIIGKFAQNEKSSWHWSSTIFSWINICTIKTHVIQWFRIFPMEFQLLMRLSKSIWRVCKYNYRTLSTNIDWRWKLWSSRPQFPAVEIHFGRQNDIYSNYCVTIWYLGSTWSSRTAMVYVVRRE